MSSDPAPSGNTPPPPTTVTEDEKLWAMLAHFAGLLGYAVALGQYIGPLVIYLLYKDKSKFVAFHALQSLYFQLGVLVAGALVVVLAFLTCVGGLLAIPLSIGALVYVIVAGIKANQGEWFEYWLVGDMARKSVTGQ